MCELGGIVPGAVTCKTSPYGADMGDENDRVDTVLCMEVSPPVVDCV